MRIKLQNQPNGCLLKIGSAVLPWVAGMNEGDIVEIQKEIISNAQALAMNRKILDLIDGNSQVYYPQ